MDYLDKGKNMKIKICFVIVNCKITGPMNQTLNIIKYLDKNRFVVDMVTLFSEEEGNSMYEAYENECNHCYCLNLTKIQSILYGSQQLKRLFDEIKPDIIHGLGMPPYRLSLGYAKAKHTVTLRNYCYEDYPSYYNKLIGYPLAFLDINLIRKKIKKGNRFVTCSKSLSAIYREHEKMEIPFIRNGVDIDKYKHKKYDETLLLRNKLNIPTDKIVFIYTGPLIERKDPETAIKGIINSKNSNSICFVLCGDGTNYVDLKKKYGAYQQIIFAGKVKNISEYLCAADVYLSASKSEGLPNSVLEAMATGLPLVLSDIPQHKELLEIDNEIGFEFEVGNEAELSERIDCICDQDYHKKGERSYQVVLNNLTAQIMSKNYEKFYYELLNN